MSSIWAVERSETEQLRVGSTVDYVSTNASCTYHDCSEGWVPAHDLGNVRDQIRGQAIVRQTLAQLIACKGARTSPTPS